MNQEILDRLMTAGAYQKKAVYALFPEEMGVHLNVIEKEIKAMAAEVMEAWMRDKGEKDRSDSRSYESGMGADVNKIKPCDNLHQQSAIKKVDII